MLGFGRSPGEGKGYPLQSSGLEDSMDCIAHGVANSRTRLSDFHFMVRLIWLFFVLVVGSINNDHLIFFFPIFSLIFLAWRRLLQSAIWCWIEILTLFLVRDIYSVSLRKINQICSKLLGVFSCVLFDFIKSSVY